jgi:integrase
MFSAEEIHRLLGVAGVQVRAMILLGINGGFGNADCGTLPRSAVNLETGWIDYPRPKTGIPRRFPLWPETVAALREVLAQQREPRDEGHAGLVFLTRFGISWQRDAAPVVNTLSGVMRQLMYRIGLGKGRNFYCLRHTFETIAGESKDQVAVDHIMGHADESMAAVYRETISDARLRAVAEHVRAWLFPAAAVPSGDRK